MFKATCSDLRFMYVVVFNQDPEVFALAREPYTKEVHLFLFIGAEEIVYKRDNHTNTWKPLEHEELIYILQSICRAMTDGLNVFKIDGKSDNLININN